MIPQIVEKSFLISLGFQRAIIYADHLVPTRHGEISHEKLSSFFFVSVQLCEVFDVFGSLLINLREIETVGQAFENDASF